MGIETPTRPQAVPTTDRRLLLAARDLRRHRKLPLSTDYCVICDPGIAQRTGPDAGGSRAWACLGLCCAASRGIRRGPLFSNHELEKWSNHSAVNEVEADHLECAGALLILTKFSN